jgi:hypothetical protein
LEQLVHCFINRSLTVPAAKVRHVCTLDMTQIRHNDIIMNKQRIVLLAGMIIAAALSRLLPHPPNFAPMNAMALFAGVYFVNTRPENSRGTHKTPVLGYGIAFAVPLLAMLLSDSVLELTTGWGFYAGMWVVYGAIMLVTALGIRLGNSSADRSALAFGISVGTYTVVGSILFFVLTNGAVWAMGTMYPHTGAGLAACFTAALPFFQNSLMGDALYTTLLFGSVALAERTFPMLRGGERPNPAPAHRTGTM